MDETMDTAVETSAPGVGVDLMTRDAAPVGTNEYQALVPDEFKNEEWVQNISKTEKPVYETFKKVNELQRMVSARPALPGPDSTPEQISAYAKAIGVPDDPSGYTYKPFQYEEADKPFGEILDKYREGPIFEAMKGVAKANNMTPQQFQNIVQAYEMNQIMHGREQLMAAAQANEDMSATMQRVGEQFYGPKFNQVCERGNALLRANTPPQVMGLLEKVPGEYLAVFAMALDGIDRKHVREDGRISGDGNYSAGLDKDGIVGEMAKIMSDPDYGRYVSPRAKGLDNQMTALRESLKRVTGD